MALSKVGLAIAGFIIWYIVSSIAAWYRLRHVPGPKLASFSYLWVARKVFFGRGRDYEQLAKYGRLVRVGPKYTVTDDPDIIRQINTAKMDRDEWYHGAKVDPHHDNVFVVLKQGPHDALKARLSFAYSGRDNIDFEDAVDGEILHLKAVIQAKYISEKGQANPLDFAHFIRYFTLDVITRLGYGKRFGFTEGGDLHEFTESIENLLGLIATAGDVPMLRRIFTSPLVSNLFAPKPIDAKGFGKVMGDAHRIVEERMEKDDEDPDMISSFKRHGLNVNQIKMEAFLQITAGSDTTATAIRTIILHLITSPGAYQRLKSEIKDAVSSGKVSYPIKLDEAKKLPYFQAVVLEGLRMRPPATYGFYKKVPSGGCTIDGKFLPEGTAIGFNWVAMMRLKSVFGPDAELFRPERFLEATEEKRLEMMRTVDLVFGHGRWMCAGKVLATFELNKTVFELMRAYHWQLMDPGNPWQELGYTIYVQRHMWVNITEDESART